MREFQTDNDYFFPPVEDASPEGLLAIGGDLSVPRLLQAYRQGIFPWYNPGQPVLWWAPDPRMVLYLNDFKISRSLRKSIKHRAYEITLDKAFAEVMHGCAMPRRNEIDNGTWITASMYDAYCELHRLGYAHSVEAWSANGELIGGLYGVALGRVFFGESMFSRATDASKVALAALVAQLKTWSFHLVDCQIASDHLIRLGAQSISRDRFAVELEESLAHDDSKGLWQLDSDLVLCP